MTHNDDEKIKKILCETQAERKQLEDAVLFALSEAKKSSTHAEVAINKSTGISVSSRLGEVETIEFNSDGALGITVYCGNKKGSATSTDLRAETIKKTVEAAINIAKYSAEDPFAGIADRELLAFESKDLDLFHPSDLDADAALSLAIETENIARNYDKKITNSEGATVNSHYRVNVYGNSHQLLQSHLSSIHSLSCSVIAKDSDSMERESEYTISRKYGQLASAAYIGTECAKKAIMRLSPRSIKTQQSAVIFTADVATGLLGHLVGAISGSSVYRKSTFLLNDLEKQIMPIWFSIYENPHIIGGLASAFYDSEGVKTTPRTIIHEGILSHWLLSSYSARKLGLISTGHAGGIYNWSIQDNRNHEKPNSLNDLMKIMGTGLVVTELMGQGVNYVTGDYSRGASGFWVENGIIQYPVSGITIAGNLRQMWQNMVAVANDIEHRSTIQTGSILIEQMQIAGS
ncbi:metalloprotease PmbA [Thorsellia kenyensis]|uniref:Metalloprotease PmbA n=1 Tax=Thorsellia kenyensis TaxID=1549888 RepID=A0ABV6CB12_9GAMM